MALAATAAVLGACGDGAPAALPVPTQPPALLEWTEYAGGDVLPGGRVRLVERGESRLAFAPDGTFRYSFRDTVGLDSPWVHVDGTWRRRPAGPWELRIARPGEADAVAEMNWSDRGVLGTAADGPPILGAEWVLPRIDVERRAFKSVYWFVEDPRRARD